MRKLGRLGNSSFFRLPEIAPPVSEKPSGTARGATRLDLRCRSRQGLAGLGRCAVALGNSATTDVAVHQCSPDNTPSAARQRRPSQSGCPCAPASSEFSSSLPKSLAALPRNHPHRDSSTCALEDSGMSSEYRSNRSKTHAARAAVSTVQEFCRSQSPACLDRCVTEPSHSGRRCRLSPSFPYTAY